MLRQPFLPSIHNFIFSYSLTKSNISHCDLSNPKFPNLPKFPIQNLPRQPFSIP